MRAWPRFVTESGGVPRLRDVEQRVGFGLAAFAALGFTVLLRGHPVLLAIGLALAALLALAAWRRNRIATAVVAFLTTFGPWVFAYVFGAPYAVYAFWVLSGARSADRRNDSSSARRRTSDRNVGS